MVISQHFFQIKVEQWELMQLKLRKMQLATVKEIFSLDVELWYLSSDISLGSNIEMQGAGICTDITTSSGFAHNIIDVFVSNVILNNFMIDARSVAQSNTYQDISVSGGYNDTVTNLYINGGDLVAILFYQVQNGLISGNTVIANSGTGTLYQPIVVEGSECLSNGCKGGGSSDITVSHNVLNVTGYTGNSNGVAAEAGTIGMSITGNTIIGVTIGIISRM